MANAPKSLYTGQPGTTNGTLYTSPASTKTIVKNIIFCNTTASAATITLNAVPSGGSATAANRFISAYSVAAGNTIVIDFSFVLETGDTLQGLQGTSAAITTLISGVTIV